MSIFRSASFFFNQKMEKIEYDHNALICIFEKTHLLPTGKKVLTGNERDNLRENRQNKRKPAIKL